VSGRSAVLAYHRVAELQPDPQLLCVGVERFADQLEHLRRTFTVTSLVELTACLRRGASPDGSVVLTFDDGYVDNLTNAKPVLEQYEAPVTVFVTTGFVGSSRELPSDVLERCLLGAGELPRILELDIGDSHRQWTIDAPVAAPLWNVTDGTVPSLRHRCYLDLHALLRPLDGDVRDSVLAALASWAGVPTAGRPDRRVLDGRELAALTGDGLVEVGAHGEQHLLLGAQRPDVQRREIAGAKIALERLLGRRVSSFAYAYGGTADIGPLASRLAREAGFDIACTTVAAPVRRRADPFMLPRMIVRDWSGADLVQHLRALLSG